MGKVLCALFRKWLAAMFRATFIRPLVAEDLPEVINWRNHPDVRRFMFTQHEISLEEHRCWFARVSHDSARHLLIVEDAQEPIGFVQLSNVCPGGVADWGFYARPDAPKGTGRKIGWAALRYAFGELGLHKVCGQAIDSNKASIAFHKKLGFKQEGALRDQQRIEGVYHTLICFGLLAHEWQPEQLIKEETNAQI